MENECNVIVWFGRQEAPSRINPNFFLKQPLLPTETLSFLKAAAVYENAKSSFLSKGLQFTIKMIDSKGDVSYQFCN